MRERKNDIRFTALAAAKQGIRAETLKLKVRLNPSAVPLRSE